MTLMKIGNLKIQRLLVLIGFALCVIYGIVSSHEADIALLSSDTVTAEVIRKTAQRSDMRLRLMYLYRNKLMYTNISIHPDTINIHEKVLLRVARSNPEKFCKIISKIN